MMSANHQIFILLLKWFVSEEVTQHTDTVTDEVMIERFTKLYNPVSFGEQQLLCDNK